MTENSTAAERAAAWAAALQEQLMPIIDRGVGVVAAQVPTEGDIAVVERQARAVAAIARSARAIVALTPAARGAPKAEPGEGGINDRDDSPESLERMRAELEARLDRLNAVLDAKGIVVEPGCWPTARSAREPVHAA
ncbi:MAG: hypothetical protein ACK4VY_03870 [Brevundimonas sp.]